MLLINFLWRYVVIFFIILTFRLDRASEFFPFQSSLKRRLNLQENESICNSNDYLRAFN